MRAFLSATSSVRIFVTAVMIASVVPSAAWSGQRRYDRTLYTMSCSRACPTTFSPKLVGPSIELDHAARHRAGHQQAKALVYLVEFVGAADQIIEIELLVHVEIGEDREIVPSAAWSGQRRYDRTLYTMSCSRACPTTFSPKLVGPSIELDHAARHRAGHKQAKALIYLVEFVGTADQVVEIELLVHVEIGEDREINVGTHR